jgi:hypothetical protein
MRKYVLTLTDKEFLLLQGVVDRTTEAAIQEKTLAPFKATHQLNCAEQADLVLLSRKLGKTKAEAATPGGNASVVG